MPAAPLTLDELTALATPASELPGLRLMREEALYSNPYRAPTSLAHSGSYSADWEAPPNTRTDDEADACRRHREILVVQETSEQASDAFGQLTTTIQQPPSTQSAGIRNTSTRTVQSLEAPSLGEECRVYSTTEVTVVERPNGTTLELRQPANLFCLFRRGPVVACSSDTFSGDAADFGLALSLAEALDTRIAAALR